MPRSEEDTGETASFLAVLPETGMILVLSESTGFKGSQRSTLHATLFVHRLEAPHLFMFRTFSAHTVSARPKHISSSRSTVLVVEDDYALREMLTRALGKYYHVFSAMNGNEALFQVASSRPDVIISDLTMPRLNGVELFQALHRNPATQDIPFIMMTGQPQYLEVYPDVQQRLAGHLVKPFDLSDLFSCVASVLEHHEAG